MRIRRDGEKFKLRNTRFRTRIILRIGGNGGYDEYRRSGMHPSIHGYLPVILNTLSAVGMLKSAAEMTADKIFGNNLHSLLGKPQTT